MSSTPLSTVPLCAKQSPSLCPRFVQMTALMSSGVSVLIVYMEKRDSEEIR